MIGQVTLKAGKAYPMIGAMDKSELHQCFIYDRTLPVESLK